MDKRRRTWKEREKGEEEKSRGPAGPLDLKRREEALSHAIYKQRARRPNTNAMIFIGVQLLDKTRGEGHGGKREGAGRPKKGEEKSSTPIGVLDSKKEESANKTAAVVDTNKAKVIRARTVIDSKDEKLIEEVKSGEKTIYKASEEVLDKKAVEAKAPELLSQVAAGDLPLSSLYAHFYIYH